MIQASFDLVDMAKYAMYIMLVGKITDINNGTQALNIVFTPKASKCS